MAQETISIPAGFKRIEEHAAILIVRDEWAERVKAVFSPLDRAWVRIAQRRFTARGRSGIASFPMGDDKPPMMVRRYVHGGILASITRDLYWGFERALDELTVAEMAREGEVRTTPPIGILCRKVVGPLWRLAYLSEEVTDSEDLIHYCCRVADYPPETAAMEKRGVIREAAAQIRRMHDIGIFHADLHLKNLLLQRQPAGAPHVYVIDFDRAVDGPALSLEQRLKNLKRMARSVRKVHVANAALTAWDRLRFLRDYLKGLPGERTLLRTWARQLALSGAGREVWWAATGAKRHLRGDRIISRSGLSSMRRGR